MFSGYGIAFYGKGDCSFHDDLARNVKIFIVDNSSSPHSDNLKNDFLILGEVPTFGINRRFGVSEKKLILVLVKQTQNFRGCAL